MSMDEFDNMFDEADDASSELRRQKAKEQIDSLLEKTLVRSVRATGRAIERVNDQYTESNSQMVKVRPGGLVVRADGTESQDSVLSLLDPDIEDYGEIEISEHKLAKIKRQMKTASIGPISTVAMICTGSQCQIKEMCPYWKNEAVPLGEECQPSGETVLTSNRGYVPIEDLNEEEDRVVSYRRESGRHLVTTGRKFRKATRDYTGKLIEISINNDTAYKCTTNHIVYASMSDNAMNKHVVYLMRKGDNFRVGETVLLAEDKTGKINSPLRRRFNDECADDLWILGVYNDRESAMVYEEYFSIFMQAPKLCFMAHQNTKWGGLYAKTNQEDLDKIHEIFKRDRLHYSIKLSELSLDINLPFISVSMNKARSLSRNRIFEMYAINLIDGLFKFPVVNNTETSGTFIFLEAKVSSVDYSGLVHSLDVEKDHNYITGNVLTHNCLVEKQLIREWVERYITEFSVDINRTTELQLVSELAEISVYERRINSYISINSPMMLQEVVAGVDSQGNAYYNLDIAKAFEIKDRLKKQRMKILDAMLATRDRKAKLVVAAASANSNLNELSSLKKRINELANARREGIVVNAEE